MPFTVYQAPPGLLAELAHEVGRPAAVRDPLVLADGPPRHLAFAHNIWLEPEFLTIASIGHGAKTLRARGRNWDHVGLGHFRRAALMAEKLPRFAPRPLVFGQPLPAAPLGAYSLWEDNLLLASAATAAPVPGGVYAFVEDKKGPPNRAYLKLWELFTRLGRKPEPGQTCLDLGGSPGGFAYVLSRLGATVLCLDKAPLSPTVAALPGVTFRQGSAFALSPRDEGPFDWLFCDVICYPDRLLRLITSWIDSGRAANVMATIKFQGPTDWEAIAAFAAIPGSTLLHLSHNKHELTFIRPSRPAPWPWSGDTADIPAARSDASEIPFAQGDTHDVPVVPDDGADIPVTLDDKNVAS